MKRKLLLALFSIWTVCLNAQNPGLVISEILANPAGTDSCKEYVEVLATQNINFSLTPYTIIVNNNGTAINQGWVSGGVLSYAFLINTGSISVGSVAYVGGNCMSIAGTQLRAINVKLVGGDGGVGTANIAGVFGNGGSNADGVAVFNLPISAITASTVPTDALFYGLSIGTASVTGGVDGYQLPVNDLYPGGKLNSVSFIAPDPAGDVILTSSGIYNLANNTWSISRTVTTGTISSSAVSSISLATSGTVSPAAIAFVSNDTTVVESVNAATIYLKLSATSSASSSIQVYATAFSNAGPTDYTLSNNTFTFPANAAVNSTAAITINLNNDAIVESAEYIILRFYNPQNATIGTINQFAFYIADNDKVIPQASNSLSLNLLSSFSNSITGSNSAEIVVHDPTTQRLYIANSIGAKLDILDFINPSSPSLLFSVPITTYGNINSVAVKNGTVALAIENGTNPQDSGRVVFMNKDGVFISQVKVGMMPDMITFNQAGTKVITANEGEPNAAYTNDPDGSVSIINVSGGVANLTSTNVTHVTFTGYNGQENALRAQGIRIYGPSASASKDFEPEYVSVSKDDTKAWVTLQENNAIVEINLLTNTITSIRALGTKNHSQLNNGYDVSNVTRGINVSNFPIKGLYLPDAIASYTVGGNNYLITANEGDSRAYTGFSEEVRISGANLDPQRFPFANELKNNYVMGRLNITDKLGDSDNDGDLDTLYSYGSRSFSIWNASTGQLVYDSKDDLELITATGSYSAMFNVSNTNVTRKDRSDDKGPEPEGVAIGEIGTATYAFIALERIGGVMVYDVTNPVSPVFVTYVNNRSLPSGGPDRGAEGIIFIPQSQSPNGMHLVIAANEISSSLSIWGIPGCSTPLSSSLSVNGATSNVCASNAPTLSVNNVNGLAYQWTNNSVNIAGANSPTYSPLVSGNYAVSISGGSNCATASLTRSISITPSPTLNVAGSSLVCLGTPITLTLSGATSYSLNGVSNGTLVSLNPLVASTYTFSGANGPCLSAVVRSITVQSYPILSIQGSTETCIGTSVSNTITGANAYFWNTGTTNSVVLLNPSVTTVYSVTGNNSGCQTSITQTIQVNPLPLVQITSGSTLVCAGETITLTATGASAYVWNNGSNTAATIFTLNNTTSFTVTGTNAKNCQAMAVYTQSVSNCTSILLNEANTGDALTLFPNPSNGSFKVLTNSEHSMIVSIYDLQGKCIACIKDILSNTAISTSDYLPGIYFVTIELNGKTQNKKLIIE